MSRRFSRPVSRSSTVALCAVRPMLARTASGSRDDVVPRDARRAARRDGQGGHHPDGRRLAGAVGPEQSEDRPLGHLEADVVDGGEVAEALDQADGLDDGSGVCTHALEGRSDPRQPTYAFSRPGQASPPGRGPPRGAGPRAGRTRRARMPCPHRALAAAGRVQPPPWSASTAPEHLVAEGGRAVAEHPAGAERAARRRRAGRGRSPAARVRPCRRAATIAATRASAQLVRPLLAVRRRGATVTEATWAAYARGVVAEREVLAVGGLDDAEGVPAHPEVGLDGALLPQRARRRHARSGRPRPAAAAPSRRRSSHRRCRRRGRPPPGRRRAARPRAAPRRGSRPGRAR